MQQPENFENQNEIIYNNPNISSLNNTNQIQNNNNNLYNIQEQNESQLNQNGRRYNFQNLNINNNLNIENNKNNNINTNYSNNDYSTYQNDNNNFTREISKLTNEKNSTMSTLRKEMIINEEQRNYIQILKEIIEKNLFGKGYIELIQNSKEFKNYNIQKGTSGNDISNTIDFFIDFSKFKLENEKFKKEINDMKKDLEDTKIELNDYKSKNENLNLEIENLKNDIEQKNENINNLNIDKENLNKEIEGLNNKINNLNNTNIQLNEQLIQYKKFNEEKEKQIEENLKLISNLQNEIQHYKNIEDKCYKLNEEVQKFKMQLIEERKLKDEFEKKYIEIQIQNDNLNQTLKNLGNNKDELSFTLQKMKEKFNLTLSYQNEIENLTSCIQERENELKNALIEIKDLECKNLKLNRENCEYENQLNIALSKNKSLSESNEKLNCEINRLKIRDSNDCNNCSNENYSNQKNLFNCENINNINCNNNCNDCNYNNQEDINYLKEQYCNEIKKLQNIIEKLNKKNFEIETEIQKVINDNHNIKNERNYNFDRISEKYNDNLVSLKELTNQVEELKEKNCQLEKAIYELNEENKNYSIEKNNLVNQLNIYINKEKYEKIFYQDDLNNLIINLEKINENCRKNNNDCLNSKIFKFKSALSIQDYMKISIKEIIELTNDNIQLKNNLKLYTQKIPDFEKEKQFFLNNQKESDLKIKDLNCIIEKLQNEINKLQNQLNDFKGINNKLKLSIENYSNELNSKNNMITNSNYDNNLYKEKNSKLTTDNQYLMSIILKLSKNFPNSNLYLITNKLINSNNISCEEKENINNNLLNELVKIENYIKNLKCNNFNSNNFDLSQNSTSNNSFNQNFNNSNENNNFNQPFKITNYKSTLKY